MSINTHGPVCEFGKHRGTLWTRDPVSYLFWMFNTGHSGARSAQAEIDRPRVVRPDLDISGHALDHASLRVHRLWQATRDRQENGGLHAWLDCVATEAFPKLTVRRGKAPGKLGIDITSHFSIIQLCATVGLARGLPSLMGANFDWDGTETSEDGLDCAETQRFRMPIDRVPVGMEWASLLKRLQDFGLNRVSIHPQISTVLSTGWVLLGFKAQRVGA